MKQQFIIHKKHPRLILFFAGWGMDEHPFLDYYPADSDLLVCYDYRNLDFDYSLLQAYTDMRLVGWSMGVWAASQVFGKNRLNIKKSIAINGTNYPVDDNRGIARTVFEGTLNGLTNATLRKFQRRMCGSATALDDFLNRAPRRDVDELREELRRIGELSQELAPSSFVWSKAVIGNKDHIFTPANQQQSWSSQTEITVCEAEHYSESLLRKVIEHG